MGKGIIKSEIGDGQYVIESLFDIVRIDARLEDIPYKINALLEEQAEIVAEIERQLLVPDETDPEPEPETDPEIEEIEPEEESDPEYTSPDPEEGEGDPEDEEPGSGTSWVEGIITGEVN